MRRVHNSDIEFKLDSKIINVANFSMKFYTVNKDNFYVRKTNDDVYEKERPITVEDVEAIESGLTSITEYYVALNWSELENIGRGVMNYQAINNYNSSNFVDLWYNRNVERTTEYYIDSDIVFSVADGRNVVEKVDDLDKGLQKEIEDRISGDLVLSDRIDNIVEHLDSGGTIDLSKFYLKTETSGATQLSEAFDAKLDASAYTPTDLSNYYNKSEVDDAISGSISTKLDIDDFNAYSAATNSAIVSVEVISGNGINATKTDSGTTLEINYIEAGDY